MATSYPINFLLNNALTLCEVKWGLLDWLKYIIWDARLLVTSLKMWENTPTFSDYVKYFNTCFS